MSKKILKGEEIIEQTCYYAGCNKTLHYRELFKYNNNLYKVEIDSDYLNVNTPLLYIFSKVNMCWERLYEIPYADRVVSSSVSNEYRNKEQKEAIKVFEPDTNKLKEILKQMDI